MLSKKILSWLGFSFLLSALFILMFDIHTSMSPFLVFYVLIILGLICSFIGKTYVRSATGNSLAKWIGKIAFYGNLMMTILYFPPFYFMWGTFIYGP